MYQLALKFEASFLVATQATNAVQCFGKGSNHRQWRCSFHCMHFHSNSPKGLLAWRPTLQICRHDLPRLGASPLEGLERLKLKEFWIIINKWYFVKWSILSNYQQIFGIILIVDHEYIKKYTHYVTNKHILQKTYREKILCKNQHIMESCHDVVNRGLVLDSWMILTTWLIPGERCIHGIGMAFSCCNIYVRSTGDMCTFFFNWFPLKWQFSLQCQVLSFLVVLKFHLCQGLRPGIGPLRETHLRGWGVCGWKHHLPMEWSGQWESWGKNSDIGVFKRQKGRLKTGFAWLCCMQESQIKNCSCWDPWKKRKHKIWNRLKILLECNIQKRELGRQMSHLPMLSRTFKRSLLGIPVLPCVLDGL